MESEIAAIEGDKTLNPDALKVDRNKLLKTAFDNKAVDTDGRWNYRLAFKLMEAERGVSSKVSHAGSEEHRRSNDRGQPRRNRQFVSSHKQGLRQPGQQAVVAEGLPWRTRKLSKK